MAAVSCNDSAFPRHYQLIGDPGLSSDFQRSSLVGDFLLCLMVGLLASPSGDVLSLLSHEILSGALT